MNFLVRGAAPDDLDDLHALARQFSLLNLPQDKKAIAQKIESSIAAFNGELKKDEAQYLFVIEDIEQKMVAGSSQVVAKHGAPGEPSYSFEILKKERFSKDLGVGFIHQILRLKINEDGPTEIGGLVVDYGYRSRPEKIGKQVSLARFLYIGMYPDNFEENVYAQMAPPLTEEGRSEFWESLGRRFTGMPYQEADLLSQKNKEFIRSLFPEEDIYLCLLDAKARLVLGRVAQETQPALHLLESIGFSYMNEVDPFDGGPHLSAKAKNVSLIKNAKFLKIKNDQSCEYSEQGLIAICREKIFLAGQTACSVRGDEIYLPEKSMKTMELSPGETIYFTPTPSTKIKGRKSGK
ncbi:MAG: arginine N-succinyltransferase [Bdellovibrionales bacterium]|nr:arginine N-succinyltransferase [Bdellovibrionales bacterium]